VITVNELLFAKASEFARSEEVSTFKSSGGAETPTRAARSLIFDGSNCAALSPIELHREILGREDRSLVGVLGELKTAFDPEMLPLELRPSQIRELRNAVTSRGIQLLVTPRSPEIGFENGESVVVLLAGSVDLAELLLEQREVILGG